MEATFWLETKASEERLSSFIRVWGTFQVEGNQITAQAGCSLAQIANAALDAALTGFEFAAGIPGKLGGAVVMNAGAYGGEMKDV